MDLEPSNRDVALVLDIVLAAKDAVLFVEGLDAERFARSRLHQNAVIRSLEIVGEATSRLSRPFRLAHSRVEWAEMIGMRNRLIHAYGDVRLDIVWDVVTSKLPPLIETLAPLIPEDRTPPSAA